MIVNIDVDEFHKKLNEMLKRHDESLIKCGWDFSNHIPGDSCIPGFLWKGCVDHLALQGAWIYNPENDSYECPNCHKSYDTDMNYCGNCGMKLNL